MSILVELNTARQAIHKEIKIINSILEKERFHHRSSAFHKFKSEIQQLETMDTAIRTYIEWKIREDIKHGNL